MAAMTEEILFVMVHLQHESITLFTWIGVGWNSLETKEVMNYELQLIHLQKEGKGDWLATMDWYNILSEGLIV